MGEVLNAAGVAIPTVGRIVHVVGERPTGLALAAIVTSVVDDLRVTVQAFPPQGVPRLPDVVLEHDVDGVVPFSWRWPPRV